MLGFFQWAHTVRWLASRIGHIQIGNRPEKPKKVEKQNKNEMTTAPAIQQGEL